MGFKSLCYEGSKDCMTCDMFESGYCKLLDVELDDD